MSSPDLIPVFIPSLASILHRSEQQKGTPLTEQEVIAIRDKSVAMMMPRAVALQMSERRGYSDIEPEQCWAQWQQLRQTLTEPPPA